MQLSNKYPQLWVHAGFKPQFIRSFCVHSPCSAKYKVNTASLLYKYVYYAEIKDI